MLPSSQPKLFHPCVCDVDLPDAHTRAGNNGETDGSGETLVTLGIIVLEADLKFDGFEEVSLLGLKRVSEKLLDVGTHSGCGAKMSVGFRVEGDRQRDGRHTDCDFRHGGQSSSRIV
jgi:hypothetical protein